MCAGEEVTPRQVAGHSAADSLITGATGIGDQNVPQWGDICTHLYHALCELIAWQAGDAEPDGEITRREANISDDGGQGYRQQRASMCRRSSRPLTHGPVGRLKPGIAASHFMEKDEDSYDRDNARRRRVSMDIK